MTKPQTYRLTLKPLPRPGGPPADVRLRGALKVLLRRFGLRCVHLEWPSDERGDEAESERGEQ